jgi:hypothetical protein
MSVKTAEPIRVTKKNTAPRTSNINCVFIRFPALKEKEKMLEK